MFHALATHIAVNLSTTTAHAFGWRDKESTTRCCCASSRRSIQGWDSRCRRPLFAPEIQAVDRGMPMNVSACACRLNASHRCSDPFLAHAKSPCPQVGREGSPSGSSCLTTRIMCHCAPSSTATASAAAAIRVQEPRIHRATAGPLPRGRHEDTPRR
jgi:hypothetical protein